MLESNEHTCAQRDGTAAAPTGVGIVSNSALYGMVIWCIGCVIPTPLDREPAPTNYPAGRS